MYQRTNIRRGMAVMSQDGVQVGRVVDVGADGIVIEKGQFFLKDFPVPFSDISTVRGEEILLARDYATLRRMDQRASSGTERGTVGMAGYAAPKPQGGLGLGPTDLTEARMDSTKFQDHGQYDLRPTGSAAEASTGEAEHRAAGPGWDPLSVDEERPEKESPRSSGPDTKPPTRY